MQSQKIFKPLKKFKSQNFTQTIGYYLEDENYYLIFGNKNLDLDKLKKIQNENKLNLEWLNQNHTTNIYAAPTSNEICDGSYTKLNLQALCLKTADCLPLVVSSTNYCFALHCGRKGLIQGIIKNLAKICQKNLRFNIDKDIQPPLKFFIGPHIHWQSYEINQEIFKFILMNYPKTESLQTLQNAYYFSLSDFVREQISLYFSNARIFELEIDTFCTENYYSYRKDSQTKSRNYTLIWKKA